MGNIVSECVPLFSTEDKLFKAGSAGLPKKTRLSVNCFKELNVASSGVVFLANKFSQCDSDKDGSVSFSDIKHGLQISSNPFSDMMLRSMDIDTAGGLGYRQFVLGLSNLRCNDPMRFAFLLFQRSGNGRVARDVVLNEMHKISKNLPVDEDGGLRSVTTRVMQDVSSGPMLYDFETFKAIMGRIPAVLKPAYVLHQRIQVYCDLASRIINHLKTHDTYEEFMQELGMGPSHTEGKGGRRKGSTRRKYVYNGSPTSGSPTNGSPKAVYAQVRSDISRSPILPFADSNNTNLRVRTRAPDLVNDRRGARSPSRGSPQSAPSIVRNSKAFQLPNSPARWKDSNAMDSSYSFSGSTSHKAITTPSRSQTMQQLNINQMPSREIHSHHHHDRHGSRRRSPHGGSPLKGDSPQSSHSRSHSRSPLSGTRSGRSLRSNSSEELISRHQRSLYKLQNNSTFSERSSRDIAHASDHHKHGHKHRESNHRRDGMDRSKIDRRETSRGKSRNSSADSRHKSSRHSPVSQSNSFTSHNLSMRNESGVARAASLSNLNRSSMQTSSSPLGTYVHHH